MKWEIYQFLSKLLQLIPPPFGTRMTTVDSATTPDSMDKEGGLEICNAGHLERELSGALDHSVSPLEAPAAVDNSNQPFITLQR